MTAYPYVMPPPSELVDTIPLSLQAIPNWVVWRLRDNPKKPKPDKIPFNAITGGMASSTDPGTWTTFDVALETAARGEYSGIGFVVTPETGIVGVDLDGCIDDSSELEPWAEDIVNSLFSYTEVSPSARGIRIFVKARKSRKNCRKGKIEVYDAGRFLTVTGLALPEYRRDVENRQEALDVLLDEVFGDMPDLSLVPKAVDGPEPVSKPEPEPTAPEPKPRRLWKIRPDAALPRKWKPLTALEPKALALFNHSGRSLPKNSNGIDTSAIDLALANYAVNAGWEDQEVVDLLVAHRALHGEGPKYRHYYELTLATARDKELKRITIGLIENQRAAGPEPEPEPEPERVAGQKTPPDSPCGKLSTLLGIEIYTVVKIASEPPSYNVATSKGTVRIPSASKLVRQLYLRDLLAEIGHYMPSFDKADWPIIAQLLLDIAEAHQVSAGAESTRAGTARAWVQSYLNERKLKPDFDQAIASRLPFLREGAVMVFGGDLSTYIRVVLRQSVSAQDFGATMRDLGAVPKTLSFRRSGKNAGGSSASVWVLPPEFSPMQEDETAAGIG